MNNVQQPNPLAIVADDDSTVRLLARTALEQMGLDVADFGNGSGALEAARAMSPNIVFLDVSMPVMDGFTTCREMRRSFADRFPIVMITGMDDAVSVNTAYEAGATDFVTKPVNWELFKHRTQFVLRGQRVLEEWREARAKSDAILDALPDTIVHVGRDGQVVDFRPGSEFEQRAFTGSLGDRFEAAAPGLVNGDLLGAIDGVARSRQSCVLEHPVQIQGQERIYELRIVPISERDALCVFCDHSKQKQHARLVHELVGAQLDPGNI